MLVNPSIESLRDQITRDRECFKAQSQRLVEIQQSDPNVLSDIDRNTLSHWDKSVVTDCNRQLLLLEEVKQPSAEERAIMKEFHELIILGDHIMEKRNLVRAELNDGLNAVKKSKASKPTPVTNEKAEPVATPLRDTSEGIGRKANVVTPRSTIDTVPDAVSMPPTGAKLPHASTASYSNNLKVGRIHDSTDVEAIDPKILYDTLRVEPDASLNDIKKATRKTILRLHPDRNPDDPNATSRFADFQGACEVFESQEKRQEFDETGDVKEIDGLQARLQGLAIK